MKTRALLPLTLRAVRRRVLLLLAFAAVMLAMAAAARLLSRGVDHVELGRIFELGGPTLGAGFLVFGWLVGRFPLIAVLTLLAGFFSHDRATGTTRLWAARPISLLTIYGIRFGILSMTAFLLAALVLPLFDLVLLGQWAGPATIVLAAAYIIAFGGLVALFSVWTRADAWFALLAGMLAIAWNALRTAGMLDAVPAGGRQFITLLLPPQGSLLALENAFGQVAPIPWNAFLDVCIYGTTMLVLAALAIQRREI